MDSSDRQKLALLRKRGLAEPLRDFGFSGKGSSLRFSRDTHSSLVHYIWLAEQYGRYYLQWSIVSAPAGEIIFEKYRLNNPDYHVVVGDASNFGEASFARFVPSETPAEAVGDYAERLAHDATLIAQNLQRFSDERALWTHLMKFSDPDGPDGDYFSPGRGSLTVLTVAALAVAASSPEACDLGRRALTMIQSKGPVGRHRARALSAALAHICDSRRVEHEF